MADLTALVLIGWREGKWRVQPTFWLPSEGLRDKAVADRVPYDLWHGQGYLQATPGKTVSYEFVSMSPALRDLEQILIEGQLAHGNHPVLSMCVANTVISLDDAGNRKPSKRERH